MGVPFAQVVQMIKKAKRPLTLTFLPAEEDGDGTGVSRTTSEAPMEPPGPDATIAELNAYKEFLLLMHEHKPEENEKTQVTSSLSAETQVILLQRLAAFFFDTTENVHT